MPIAPALCMSMASHGVANRGCTFPRNENVRPSRAIAKATRGRARQLPLSAPNTLTVTASMIAIPPAGPAIDSITVRAIASFCCDRMPIGIMYR